MKTRIVLVLVGIMLAIVGCRHLSKRPAAKPPPAPLPSGFKPSAPRTAPHIIRTAPSYVPTDFAVVSVKAKQGSVFLTWINGSPPFQVQSRPDVLSPWTDFGPSTTLRSLTNSAPYGFTRAFFRVKSIATTPGALQFVRQSTAGNSGNARSFSCATDLRGNTFIAGIIGGTVDFATPGSGPIIISSSAVLDNDGFFAKYDAQGRALWAKRFGSTRSDIAQCVTVDKQGNIIVTGQFTGDADFGGTTLTTGGSVNADIFVAKYDTANPPNLIWAKGFGGTSLDRGWTVTVDANNNVLLGSIISSAPANFGGIVLNSAGLDDVALAKLSGVNGATLWAKRYGGMNNDRPGAVAVNNSGDVWVTGTFFGASDLGSGPINSSPAVNKAFLARYSGTDGSYRIGSLRTIGTKDNNAGNGITIDAQSGNVLITGGVSGAVDFGGGLVLNAGSTEGNAIFIAAYGPTGNYLWAKELGDGFSTGIMMGSSVAADGLIAITGQTSALLNIGNEWLTGYGYFVIGFNSAGDYQWSRIASGGPSTGGGIAYDSIGRIVAAGFSSGLVNFGRGPNGQDIIGTAPNGIPNSFMAQYLK